MNKTSFLDYYKTILEKVSFDDLLLAKEYQKAKSIIDQSQHYHLDDWMYRTGLINKLRT
ncbi:hypothetical protein [Fulvivirga sp. M361]|uniref:hypothetical protein n=1 Tax=Fulvivirga sp. M361 TaxID=2594266 RepID=UPI00162AEE35|nr:hypothetical protein [Fulvivirga sp. M361]